MATSRSLAPPPSVRIRKGSPRRNGAARAPDPAAENGEKVKALGQVLEFMRLLWAVDHGLEATSKHMETTLAITGPQRLTVRIVGRFPGISAGELAEILLVHPSTLTGVLRRLEERGVITRRPDPADARRAVLGLTSKGKRIDRVRSGTVESAVQAALGRVTRPKVQAAAEVLRAIATELGND